MRGHVSDAGSILSGMAASFGLLLGNSAGALLWASSSADYFLHFVTVMDGEEGNPAVEFYSP